MHYCDGYLIKVFDKVRPTVSIVIRQIVKLERVDIYLIAITGFKRHLCRFNVA